MTTQTEALFSHPVNPIWWIGGIQMNGDNETFGEDQNSQSDGRSPYERSTIAFPYFDLDEGVRMAKAMSRNVGSSEAADEQLAAWLGLSPKSSGYRGRLAATRLFGLLDQTNDGNHQLTDLGLKIVSDQHARAAKANAFEGVPLFKKVYDQWRGQQLPPPAGLERTMMQMGVAQKQTARARQVLERSAESAGYFEQGRDRLVRPGVKQEKLDTTPPPPPGGKGNGGGFGEHDPLIIGIFQKLPPRDTDWPMKDRITWLKTASLVFELVYGLQGNIRIEPADKDGEA